MTPNKFWVIYTLTNEGKFELYKTYAEASDAAKIKAFEKKTDVFILETVAFARQPIPNIEIAKL